ncbi:MAG TPA: hypothetical protein ENG50_05300 [Candidatus Altiarchaeales archaeon]|nr:hypothetical protein [Candidatus Altiarchaeales archaeon]
MIYLWIVILPKVKEMIEDVRKRVSIKENEIYATGFSGGGMGCYVIAYFHPIFKGLIINSGAIHPNLYNPKEIRKINVKKIVLICGRKDGVVPCAYMQKDKEFLEKAGFETYLIEFNGSHEIAPAEIYEKALRYLIE